jgi:hypothetical protein
MITMLEKPGPALEEDNQDIQHYICKSVYTYREEEIE